MYSYENFVAEVETLINVGKTMLNNPTWTHESSGFRKWKHQLEDAVNRIQDEDYAANVKIGSRYFRPLYPCSVAEQHACFDSELDQTLIELQTILDNYHQYGRPRRRHERLPVASEVIQSPSVLTTHEGEEPLRLDPALVEQPLLPPENVTLAWLFKHVPVPIWGAAIGCLFVAFSAGVTVGKFWKDWPYS